MNDSEKWKAIVTNDRSCDGAFLYGVRSTGIFCRPSCASRPPKRENVVFFDTAEEAERMGFRPCKRCRPELLDYDPVAALAAEARAIIDHSFAERSELQEKLNALGVTRRHLTGIFERQYGLSPRQYTARVRLDRAKALLERGDRITDAAFAVGLESAAAFATFFKKEAGVTPSEYAARRIEARPYCLCETPLGVMRIEEDARGITALQFAENASEPGGTGRTGHYLTDAEAQLSEYFEGRRRAFELPLSPAGTAFQARVWRALRDIPYGETRNYQAVAAAVGNADAARAVGMACNRNPILILIPCHRVVGKSGKLVGYAGGIDRKRHLLEMEAAR